MATSRFITHHSQVSSPISTSLTPGQRRRSQQKLDALQAEFDIRSEKFKQMTKAVAIEAGTAFKFQLEQQATS